MTFLDKGGMAHRNIGKKISLFKRERERERERHTQTKMNIVTSKVLL